MATQKRTTSATKKTAKKIPKVNLTIDEPNVIGYGRDLMLPVYGEHYAQGKKMTTLKQLYQSFGKNIIQFSLTPPSDYQREKEWPEKPFLNVNTIGAVETDRENWLGYIHAFPPSSGEKYTSIQEKRQKYTSKIVAIGHVVPLVISGKIVKEGSRYSIILLPSASSVDKMFPVARELAKNPDTARKRKAAEQKRKQQIADEKRHKKITTISIALAVAVVVVILCIIFWEWVFNFLKGLIAFIVAILILGFFFSSGGKKKRRRR